MARSAPRLDPHDRLFCDVLAYLSDATPSRCSTVAARVPEQGRWVVASEGYAPSAYAAANGLMREIDEKRAAVRSHTRTIAARYGNRDPDPSEMPPMRDVSMIRPEMTGPGSTDICKNCGHTRAQHNDGVTADGFADTACDEGDCGEFE